jgi:hypothetical protein
MTTNNAGKPLSQDDCDELCRMYEEGVPPKDIVARFGIHRTTLPKLYKRLKGITRSLLPQIGNPRYFQTLDSHEKAYFVGFIAADGCIVDHSNTGGNDALAINIHSKDRLILEELRKALELEHPLYEITTKNQVAVRVTSQTLCDDLRQYGLDYRKSLTMGNIFPRIPEEFRDSFALGYLDGDGSIYIKRYKYKSVKSSNAVEYQYPSLSVCGTREFLIGFTEHFGISDSRIRLKNSIHELNVDKLEDFWSIYCRIYSKCPIFLQRKRDVVHRLGQVQTISSSAT